MVIKVYVSGISASKEVKKRQQRVLLMLDSFNVNYETIDITEPGREEERVAVQVSFKNRTNDTKRTPLPPQFFNEDGYCGDYEDFNTAVDLDQLLVFLKLEELKPSNGTNGIEANQETRGISQDKENQLIEGEKNQEEDKVLELGVLDNSKQDMELDETMKLEHLKESLENKDEEANKEKSDKINADIVAIQNEGKENSDESILKPQFIENKKVELNEAKNEEIAEQVDDVDEDDEDETDNENISQGLSKEVLEKSLENDEKKPTSEEVIELVETKKEQQPAECPGEEEDGEEEKESEQDTEESEEEETEESGDDQVIEEIVPEKKSDSENIAYTEKKPEKVEEQVEIMSTAHVEKKQEESEQESVE